MVLFFNELCRFRATELYYFLWYTKFQVKQNINILNSLLPEISSSKRYRSIDVLSIFLCVRYHIYSLHTHVMFSMILLLVQMNVTGKIY